MAPPTLNVTKGRDGYILHWREEKMSYSHIACIFQVQYKKEGASWEVRDCAQGGAWRGGCRERGQADQPQVCVLSPGRRGSMSPSTLSSSVELKKMDAGLGLKETVSFSGRRGAPRKT